MKSKKKKDDKKGNVGRKQKGRKRKQILNKMKEE